MTTVRFDGRVAIVTGAGSGLGRDYARALAARGASVVVNDLGTDPLGNLLSSPDAESPAQAIVREITAVGGKAVACHASCATRAGGAAIVDAAMQSFGRVDILIHNAGFLRNAPFEDLTDEQIRSIMDVHLMAGFYVGQPAFRIMKQQRYGRVIFTSSASGVFGAEWQANYAAAKTGLVGLINVLALEGARHGILANGLLPCGASRLGRGEREWPADFQQGMPKDFSLVVPAIRNDFVVPMVVWLAHECCSTTRSLYSATGGRFARVFVAESKGWLSDQAQPPSAEDIQAHLAEIDRTDEFDIPASMWDEFVPIIEATRAKQASERASERAGGRVIKLLNARGVKDRA